VAFIPKKLKLLNVPNVYLEENPLKWVDCQKYLGVFFCKDRSDFRDMKREMRSIYARGNLLIRKFGKCNSEVKLHLFKTYCSNFYCSQLWCFYNKSMYKKIKVAYNNVFRKLCNVKGICSISQLFVFSNIDPFEVIVRKSKVSLQGRLMKSTNTIVATVLRKKLEQLYF